MKSAPARIVAASSAASALFAALPASAQPSDPAGFATIIDLGTGYPSTTFRPLNGITNTQINLYPGGLIQTGILSQPGPNVEINFRGGDIDLPFGSGLSTSAGSLRVNVATGIVRGSVSLFGGPLWVGGGQINGTVELYQGAQLTMTAGTLIRRLSLNNTVGTVSSGTLNQSFNVSGLQGVLNLTGGTVTGLESRVANRGVLNFSGGTVDVLQVFQRGTANFFGTSFLIDGVSIAGLNVGEAFTITQRIGIFSGLLSDGSAFSYNLAGELNFASSHFSTDSLLTVTLIPAPSAAAILTLSGLLATRRQRR